MGTFETFDEYMKKTCNKCLQRDVTCPKTDELNIFFEKQSAKRNAEMEKRSLNYPAGVGDTRRKDTRRGKMSFLFSMVFIVRWNKVACLGGRRRSFFRSTNRNEKIKKVSISLLERGLKIEILFFQRTIAKSESF